jgi:hypothetical protein
MPPNFYKEESNFEFTPATNPQSPNSTAVPGDEKYAAEVMEDTEELARLCTVEYCLLSE